MNNTFVSLDDVLRGWRGLNEVSENKKMAILQEVFLPIVYLPRSPRKPIAESHVTFKEKRIKIYMLF